MGLLNSALQIGRSAILTYGAALNVVGNNISSAASPDFTRLTPILDPIQGAPVSGELQPGAGVALNQIQRNIDEALESRMRLAIGANESALVQQSSLAQIEPLFDELTQTGVGRRLSDFFNAFDELQNTPEDPAIRELVVNNGARLAESLRTLRDQLTTITSDADGQISTMVEEADAIAREIARLNEDITTAEGGRRGQATGLRDQRDAALRRLSQRFDVTVREQPDGTVNVYIGNEALVQGNTVRGLVAVSEPDGDLVRTTVRFEDTNQEVDVRGGSLEGLLLSRSRDAQIEQIDELAAALIEEVNRIHADGQGLVGFTSVVAAQDVLATDALLGESAAGLSTSPTNGSFFIAVADTATGTPVAYRIDIDPSDTTTLETLRDDINAQVTGVTASITVDNRLAFTADDGFSFTFGHDGQSSREDTSGVLAALGINTFFTGSDATSIAVNETLEQDSFLLAASSEFLPGDGGTASRIAGLDTAGVSRLRELSLTGFHRSIANSVAIRAAAVRDDVQATGSVLASLSAQRESISGVNLDEEAIALLKYERAFQGTSRFVRVVDDLISELLALVR